MNNRIEKYGFNISEKLYQLVCEDVLPGLDIDIESFWRDFGRLFEEFIPQNQALLATREALQQKIDEWHLSRRGQSISMQDYQQFLLDIGYLQPEVADFEVATDNVDNEVSSIAGPQLVVPIMNARYALNAANARWGSLYDSLYGTDVIDEQDGAEQRTSYNPVRGDKVIAFAKDFLDSAIPLNQGEHSQVTNYSIVDDRLVALLESGTTVGLSEPEKLIGYIGDKHAPQSLLFKNNNLHLEVQIDSTHVIGQADKAGVKDIVLEAAVSTIQDCEDSIAAVDGEDKTLVYRNWLGLMKGTLSEEVSKGERSFTRCLNEDRNYSTLAGGTLTLPGRSLLFVRNVGHLMTNDAILTPDGHEVPEGIMDGMITALIAMHDLMGNGNYKNSRTGSVYIVKPKMHGPEEVAFTNQLFARIEEYLGLAQYTLKVGIMDEERRTSANLKNCIYEVRNRVAFINTGFLDRTGDEIHTSMHAGPVVPKDDMKTQKWLSSYEKRNVSVGLRAGLQGKAQIGKGMWAVPDNMAQMLEEKVSHPLSGANCAWVPSPTAAVLHAMHYHQVDVSQRQQELKEAPCESLDPLLTIPLLKEPKELTAEKMQHELDNNIQGILGYVVRWIDAGIGCSKVPDINNVGKMEDRATLRIASQHIANWLLHGLLTDHQIRESLYRMAATVDQQNANTPGYQNMCPDFESSVAFQAAEDLIFKGVKQPSGYTEPLLHKRRRELKSKL